MKQYKNIKDTDLLELKEKHDKEIKSRYLCSQCKTPLDAFIDIDGERFCHITCMERWLIK